MKTVEITYRYGAAGGTPRPRPQDTEAARRRLVAGNREFAAMLAGLTGEGAATRRVVEVDVRDLGLTLGGHVAPPQRPFAAVIGCSDARVPVELIFNEGPNDLFVVRIAGNGLGADVLGSVGYASEHLRDSLKLVVVLAHSGCGAMTAAVDLFLRPDSYLALAGHHALRNILDRQLIVVQACAKFLTAAMGPGVTGRAGYRQALVELSIMINAALAAHTVQHQIGGDASNTLRSVFGVYLLETHEVWVPGSDSADATGLAYPPTEAGEFQALAETALRSGRIVSLLRAR